PVAPRATSPSASACTDPACRRPARRGRGHFPEAGTRKRRRLLVLMERENPMSLKQRLTDDMKAAMKSGDKASLGVIRLMNAAIKQREVDERVELDDGQVLAALEKMV